MLGTSEARDCLWDTESVGLREGVKARAEISKTKTLTKNTRITSLKNRQREPRR